MDSDIDEWNGMNSPSVDSVPADSKKALKNVAIPSNVAARMSNFPLGFIAVFILFLVSHSQW